MSVTVRHLNADSTFLLTFSPEPQPSPADLRSENGAYTVLIDPWLAGDSIVSAPWFAITKLVIPSHIQDLSEIEEPDVVVVSQNKPDHCHKKTLLQLRPEGKTIIAAEPGAAKTVKSWNHFDPNRVYAMKKYDAGAKFGNSLRLRIPPLSPNGHAGELNISFIPAKNYMTGLHNGFGITYQAPTRTKTFATVPTVDLPHSNRRTKYFHMPMSPATLPPSSPPRQPSLDVRAYSLDQDRGESLFQSRSHASIAKEHRPQLSRSSNTASSDLLPAFVRPGADWQPVTNVHQRSTSGSFSSQAIGLPFSFESDTTMPTKSSPHLDMPTPPDSPVLFGTTCTSPISSSSYHFRTSLQPPSLHSRSTSTSTPISPIHPARPKPLSVLYCPHGLPLSDLQPYIQTHLISISALPLTLLHHAFAHVQNPWYMGGNIMTGSLGGIAIARFLMARVWISAHDEAKDDKGLAVRGTKTTRSCADDIRRQMWQGGDGLASRLAGQVCDVRSLAVGAEMTISTAQRDLWGGVAAEEDDNRGGPGTRRESRLLRVGLGVIGVAS